MASTEAEDKEMTETALEGKGEKDDVAKGGAMAAPSDEVAIVENPQEALSPSKITNMETEETNHDDDDNQDNGRETPLTEEDSMQVKSDSLSPQSSKSLRRAGWKTRKRGRQVRVASVDESKSSNGDSWHIHDLPSNQYETDVRRRAVKKGDDQPKTVSMRPKYVPGREPSSRRSIFQGVERTVTNEGDIDEYDGYDEEFGDVSLGMKLNMYAKQQLFSQ